MLWEVDIYSAEGQPDLIAQEIADSAADLGLTDDLQIVSGRGYLIQGDLDEAQVRRIADELLADQVGESAKCAAAAARGSTSATPRPVCQNKRLPSGRLRFRPRIARRLEQQRATLDSFEQNYSQDQARYAPLAAQILAAEASQEEAKKDLTTLKDEITTLSTKLLRDGDTLAVLARDVEIKEDEHKSLAARMEAVKQLEISAKQASRSGAVILYRAQASPVKVAPARTKIVLVAMFAWLLFSAALAVLEKIMREA